MEIKHYNRIDFEERIKIETYIGEKLSISEISRRLERSKSSISREVSRPFGRYRAFLGEVSARRSARWRRKERKMTLYPKLREEVLNGLRRRWSPKQISMVLKMNYPDDETMQISHEAIYSFIYVLARGELKRELISFLRQKKKTRVSRMNKRKKRTYGEMISIEERPKEVAKRSLAGDWEGDLILGRGQKSAIGTLVERKTRTVLLVPIKTKKAEFVRRAFEKKLKTLPEQMKLSLTYDQGSEMAEHESLRAREEVIHSVNSGMRSLLRGL